ncbi:uncharacterized protein LOC5510701 isoform X2 [Nematostella vectensis]|uniref:uncharacterized protein LOC5510701 isoform X2 n=1 Tax=Nematostella vectensis TaxID=45351 RepID=UPI0020774ECB|nr:uncharacterized protein LOC5510701 isoform X2 [Nematostella vectensis]
MVGGIKLGVVILFVQLWLVTSEKFGLCPRAGPYGPCVVTCGADEHCEGIKKCCSNGCGAWCSEPTCPSGQTKVDCPLSLCNYAGCPNKPRDSLRCSVAFCDQCKVNFYNVTTGEEVDCGPEETLCVRMREASQNNGVMLGQYIPECDPSGAFKQTQCHEGYCFCVDKHGIPDMKTRVRGKPTCPEKTLCQKQMEEALKLPPMGRFVPSCEGDGSFSAKQCHPSTGQCWCVDEYGREWLGTRSRGQALDCKQSVCPKGVSQMKCDVMLCKTATCPGYEKASCRVNPCGACKPEFLDQYNRPVKCLTSCQSQRNEALGVTLGSPTPTPVVGKYIPQCTPEGEYKQVQCYGSTGYCWCVDQMGSPVLGTIVRGVPQCNSSAVGVCPPGKPMFTCLRNMCQYASCPAYPDAGCRVNPCAGCRAEFLDANGDVILDCNKGMTNCQTKRAAALQGSQGGLQPVGRFLPSCDVKGAYEKIQCWGSIGFCWCVDSSGNEIKGTRVRGTPSCDTTPAPTASVAVVNKEGFCPFKQPRDSAFCSQAKKCSSDGSCGGNQKCCNSTCGLICQDPLITACPNGRPFLLCLHMCNFAQCPAHPNAKCVSDPCRMCHVEFRDDKNNVVDCKQGLTDCQLRRHQAAGLLGAFRPLCDNAGAYEKIQSHEGYYWCVDSQGREINGTRLRFNKPTTCTSNSSSDMSLCQLQASQSQGSGPRMMVGRYVPQCDKDGSFHQVQCHPSTGFCWCVNTTSGIVVRNTQTRGRPDCTKACSPVMCLMYCEFGFVKDQYGCEICKCAYAPAKPGFCGSGSLSCSDAQTKCQYDGDCAGADKCCNTQCGKICTSAVLKEKTGFCPKRRVDHVGVCVNYCGTDGDCAGDKKCCSNGCGRTCTSPVRQACPEGQPVVMCLRDPCESASCPANPMATCRPNYCGTCSAEFYDERNNKVNCTSGLTRCQRSYLEAQSRGPLIGAYIPQCDKDGRYSALQCHGSTGYCWCVNPETGEELLGTRKQPGSGLPSCNATKTSGPTCPSNSKRFRLCESSLCANTNCTRNPRARCVAPMGACGTCRPKHYDYDGSAVDCMTECQRKKLEATEGGLLGAYHPSCNADGTYTLVQCHEGYCWCSSPDGREWPGTRARGQPKCLRERMPEIKHVHVTLRFKNNFDDVKDSVKDFSAVLKTHICKYLSIKAEQIQELSVKSGSIVVEFNVVAAKDGQDLSTFEQDIYNKVRQNDIVVSYGGMTFVTSPQEVQASAQYSSDSKAVSSKGMSSTTIALICVFVALAVVVVAIVVVVVKRRRNRDQAGTDGDSAGFLYKDGRAESYSTTAQT